MRCWGGCACLRHAREEHSIGLNVPYGHARKSCDQGTKLHVCVCVCVPKRNDSSWQRDEERMSIYWTMLGGVVLGWMLCVYVDWCMLKDCCCERAWRRRWWWWREIRTYNCTMNDVHFQSSSLIVYQLFTKRHSVHNHTLYNITWLLNVRSTAPSTNTPHKSNEFTRTHTCDGFHTHARTEVYAFVHAFLDRSTKSSLMRLVLTRACIIGFSVTGNTGCDNDYYAFTGNYWKTNTCIPMIFFV